MSCEYNSATEELLSHAPMLFIMGLALPTTMDFYYVNNLGWLIAEDSYISVSYFWDEYCSNNFYTGTNWLHENWKQAMFLANRNEEVKESIRKLREVAS